MHSKLIFKILLVCFSFLLIPSSYWHECEDTHKNLKVGINAFDNDHEDCSICDFKLFQLDNPYTFELSFTKIKFLDDNTTLLFLKETNLDLNFNKGPPTC